MRRTKGTFPEAGETSLCVIREDSANSPSKGHLPLGVEWGEGWLQESRSREKNICSQCTLFCSHEICETSTNINI
jgi:hypothetical protein